MTQLSLRNKLRLYYRKQRRQLSLICQNNAAAALSKHVLTHPALAHSSHIGLYAPFDGEINTEPVMDLLFAQGKRLYLPRVHPFAPQHLLFLEHTAHSSLRRSDSYGIRTPPLHLSIVKPIQQLEVLLVPLVAFDRRGYRLGMGGGFYDRLLCRPHPFQVIGLAYSQQEIEHIPNEIWDVPLPEIITEHEVIRCDAK